MSDLKYMPNIQWEITSICNHNCTHCYNYWRKDEEIASCMSKKLTTEEYLNIADAIISQKPVSVVITGGEPLLAFEAIKPSIERLLKNGIFVSINTNAALLTDEIAEYLKNLGIGIFVSFPSHIEEDCDRITNTKNSFENITRGLDIAYKHGLNFVTNTVVSKLNLYTVYDTVLYLKKRYNIKKAYLTRVGRPSNSSDAFNYFLLKPMHLQMLQDISVKLTQEGITIDTACPYTACSIYSQEAFDIFGFKMICTAGKTSCAIDVDGNIKACPRDSHTYGNILVEGFEHAIEQMKPWRDGSFLPVECQACKERYKCQGGCRVDSYPMTGKLNQLDTISNLYNIPLQYKPKKSQDLRKTIDENKTYYINENLRTVKDKDIYRISIGRKYIYVTEEMNDFISKFSSFTLSNVEKYFDIPKDLAIDIIVTLLTNDIIDKLR